MLEALALYFHRGEDQAVPYEMRRVSYSFTSFKTENEEEFRWDIFILRKT